MVDGYYEWKQNVAGSQNKSGSVPYFIRLPDNKSMALAGLYFYIPDTDALKLVLMTQSSTLNDVLKPIHHRMPVLLDE